MELSIQVEVLLTERVSPGQALQSESRVYELLLNGALEVQLLQRKPVSAAEPNPLLERVIQANMLGAADQKFWEQRMADLAWTSGTFDPRALRRLHKFCQTSLTFTVAEPGRLSKGKGFTLEVSGTRKGLRPLTYDGVINAVTAIEIR